MIFSWFLCPTEDSGKNTRGWTSRPSGSSRTDGDADASKDVKDTRGNVLTDLGVADGTDTYTEALVEDFIFFFPVLPLRWPLGSGTELAGDFIMSGCFLGS